jgi:uncharacterized low-complexity protein
MKKKIQASTLLMSLLLVLTIGFFSMNSFAGSESNNNEITTEISQDAIMADLVADNSNNMDAKCGSGKCGETKSSTEGTKCKEECKTASKKECKEGTTTKKEVKKENKTETKTEKEAPKK